MGTDRENQSPLTIPLKQFIRQPVNPSVILLVISGSKAINTPAIFNQPKGEIKMTKIYKAYVYEKNDYYSGEYFLGEIDGINIRTNILELSNTPIEFSANSKKELLAEMVNFLKGNGHTGVLRVVNWA